jgi:hypothetical protein
MIDGTNQPQPEKPFDARAGYDGEMPDLQAHADPMPQQEPQQQPVTPEPQVPEGPKPIAPLFRDSAPSQIPEAKLPPSSMPFDRYDRSTWSRTEKAVTQDRTNAPEQSDREFILKEIARLNGIVEQTAKRLRDVWPVRLLTELDDGFSRTYRVVLQMTSGGAGSKTTAVSYVYTVKDFAGNTLATGAIPEWPLRTENGKRNAATGGLAYYNAAGAIRVAVAFEGSGKGGC